MKKQIIIRRFLIFLCTISLIGITAILMIDYIVNKNGQEFIFEKWEENYSVAIVLGAYVEPDGTLCDMLKDRVVTAVGLYKQGKVKKLLMTGDHGKNSYDEVNSMRKYAEQMGVPTEDIFMDHAGFSTYESMYRAKAIFKIDSAVIVTQKFHLPRAVYTARKLNIDAKGIIADKSPYYGVEYNELREIPARVKAFVQTNVTRSQPTFLGPQIPIDGDGRATHDGK